MYYLLNNNLIIDKNDKRIKNLTYSMDKTQTFVYLECDSKTPEAIFNCAEFYYATRHLVVKQSENVFDLLNVGDLIVQQFDDIGEWVEQIQEIDSEGIHTFNWCIKDCELITKVYKKINKDYLIMFERVVVDDK